MPDYERPDTGATVPSGYNTPIPSQITTPDRVDTWIGSL
jgi:hypothetical protein